MRDQSPRGFQKESKLEPAEEIASKGVVSGFSTPRAASPLPVGPNKEARIKDLQKTCCMRIMASNPRKNVFAVTDQPKYNKLALVKPVAIAEAPPPGQGARSEEVDHRESRVEGGDGLLARRRALRAVERIEGRRRGG